MTTAKGQVEMDESNQAVAPGEVSTSESEGPHPAFLKFLESDLVVNRVMQYLSFRDMKVFSVLSKGTLAAVRNSFEFSKRFHLMISDRFQSPELDEALQNSGCPYLWHSVSFDLHLPTRVDELIADKLEFLESLHLWEDPVVVHDTSKLDYAPGIHDLLRKTRNLRELEVKETFLAFHLGKMVGALEMHKLFKNLEALALRSRYMPQGRSDLQQALEGLSRCSPLRLTKLALEVIDDCKPESDLDLDDAIPKLVGACKDTLEELELPLITWKLEEMKVIRCPKLKRLSFSVNSDDAECFKAFLQTQPLVEDLRVKYYNALTLNEVFECLEGRLAKVRKFQVISSLDEGARYAKSGKETDFSFLKEMAKLEEFYLKSPAPKPGSGPKLFQALPDKLKKLTLDPAYPIFGNYAFGGFDWFRRMGGGIGVQLKRFRNLTHLDLQGFADIIIDEDMQEIIKSFPNLKELAIGNNTCLSDFGITGVREGGNQGGPGVPLSNLTELVALTIKYCRATPARVASVVRFRNLRSFVYLSTMIEDKEAFLEQIRGQNPRLKFLRTSVMGQTWDWDMDKGEGRWRQFNDLLSQGVMRLG